MTIFWAALLLVSLALLVGYMIGKFKPIDEVTVELWEVGADGHRRTREAWLATGDSYSITDGRGVEVFRMKLTERGRMAVRVITDEAVAEGFR